LCNMNHPPVAALDSNSIVVGHLPFQMEWKSKVPQNDPESYEDQNNGQTQSSPNPGWENRGVPPG
jgi:hypothetical protein